MIGVGTVITTQFLSHSKATTSTRAADACGGAFPCNPKTDTGEVCDTVHCPGDGKTIKCLPDASQPSGGKWVVNDGGTACKKTAPATQNNNPPTSCSNGQWTCGNCCSDDAAKSSFTGSFCNPMESWQLEANGKSQPGKGTCSCNVTGSKIPKQAGVACSTSTAPPAVAVAQGDTGSKCPANQWSCGACCSDDAAKSSFSGSFCNPEDSWKKEANGQSQPGKGTCSCSDAASIIKIPKPANGVCTSAAPSDHTCDTDKASCIPRNANENCGIFSFSSFPESATCGGINYCCPKQTEAKVTLEDSLNCKAIINNDQNLCVKDAPVGMINPPNITYINCNNIKYFCQSTKVIYKAFLVDAKNNSGTNNPPAAVAAPQQNPSAPQTQQPAANSETVPSISSLISGALITTTTLNQDITVSSDCYCSALLTTYDLYQQQIKAINSASAKACPQVSEGDATNNCFAPFDEKMFVVVQQFENKVKNCSGYDTSHNIYFSCHN